MQTHFARAGNRLTTAEYSGNLAPLSVFADTEAGPEMAQNPLLKPAGNAFTEWRKKLSIVF